MTLQTKTRHLAGKTTAEVGVFAEKPVPADAERWDIEYGDGSHAVDVIESRKAPNAGLARAMALKLIRAMKREHGEDLYISQVEVRTYEWVPTEFEDPWSGHQTVLDADSEQRTSQYGSYDESASAVTWGPVEPYRD